MTLNPVSDLIALQPETCESLPLEKSDDINQAITSFGLFPLPAQYIKDVELPCIGANSKKEIYGARVNLNDLIDEMKFKKCTLDLTLKIVADMVEITQDFHVTGLKKLEIHCNILFASSDVFRLTFDQPKAENGKEAVSSTSKMGTNGHDGSIGRSGTEIRIAAIEMYRKSEKVLQIINVAGDGGNGSDGKSPGIPGRDGANVSSSRNDEFLTIRNPYV